MRDKCIVDNKINNISNSNNCLRKMREDLEDETLSPFAARSAKSKGRLRLDEPCSVRTEFQRDRDRILYSKSFRRLMHKTQVFIAPEGDHYRTRLTHTLEVSQIARTIARALRLNEDLTEAIAMGHDLGHAPFGHAGERALNILMKETVGDGFHHSVQSLRVVDCLERSGGLNLTWEVRNGIISHTKGNLGVGSAGIFEEPGTCEAQVVRISDRIAYLNHDVDDAIRAGIITTEDFPSKLLQLFGRGLSSRISSMIKDIVDFSWNKPGIGMSPKMEKGLDYFKDFMFKSVYENSIAKEEEPKAEILVRQLFEYFLGHPDLIPAYIMERAVDCPYGCIRNSQENLPSKCAKKSVKNKNILARATCDYIAGMTDRFAVAKHGEIFVPRGWNLEVNFSKRYDSSRKD